MHVVDAFNPDNFFGVTENIFGPARECALVGLKGVQLAYLDEMQPRPCELILKIESADDLALGMLNKPQYFGEVLHICAAARSGGDAWLKEIDALHKAREIAHHAVEQARLAREAADQVENVLRGVENSRSWRLTKPLRVIRRMFQ